MDRREFLKAAGATAIWLSLAGCGGGTASAERKPNIVLFMADDLGYETLGAYGGTSFSTPVLDGLATGGIRFDHCYSQVLCTPSRVEILTGLYNQRNYTAFGIMAPGQTTFAHVLADAGYATCIVGKWQLYGAANAPEDVQGTGTLPDAAGFDEHCLWQVTGRGSRYLDPEITQNGEILPDTGGEFGPDVFAAYATDFIARQGERPFLLYYPMVLPHAPFTETPNHPDWPTKPGNDPALFGGMVSYIDEIVGRIVAALDDNGVRNDTLVLFTGDNGTDSRITSVVGGTPVTGGKSTTTDTGTHVPLIVNWPGTVPAGRTTDDLVDFSDVLPTMAALAGIEPPSGLDGRSFAPRLLGTGGPAREWVFVYHDPERLGPTDPIYFARDRRWKLYGDGNLYDVPADALEANPVPPGASPEADEARTRLQAVLDSLL
ncbi:MAG: sulfatase-like hydrolase/transferase [Actinomycetota bacterium]